VCEPCAASSFKEDVSNTRCTQCEASFTTRDPGSTAEALCVCPPGRYKDVLFEACPENHVKPSFSNEACTPCHRNSKLPAGAAADAQAQCECDPGFYESTDPSSEQAALSALLGRSRRPPAPQNARRASPTRFLAQAAPGARRVVISR